MKKLILIFLAIFMLAGCTGNKGSEAPVDNGNTETETKTEEVIFPYEETEGYWVLLKGGAYFRIYKLDNGLYCFEEGDFKDYTTGEIVPTGCEDTGNDHYVFKTYYKEMNNLSRDIEIDLHQLENDFIEIDGEIYCRVGTDEAQAKMANDWYLQNSFVDLLTGYWNGDFNEFTYVGKNDDGDFVMVFGLYDSEPGGTWVIDKLERDPASGVYTVTLTDLYTRSKELTATFDIGNANQGEIRINGDLYTYAGETLEEAYDVYAAKFH